MRRFSEPSISKPLEFPTAGQEQAEVGRGGFHGTGYILGVVLNTYVEGVIWKESQKLGGTEEHRRGGFHKLILINSHIRNGFSDSFNMVFEEK